MSTPKKNKFDFATPEIRQKFINEIIGFFQTERGEEIGIIGAEAILDFVVDLMGPEIYKKATLDVKSLLKQKMTDIELEIDSLT